MPPMNFKQGKTLVKSLTYKNHTASVKYSAEDGHYIGHIAGINDIAGFQFDSMAEAEKTFRESVDDYLDACREVGKNPDKPIRTLSLRMPPKVHASVAIAAKCQGQSISRRATDVLRRAASAWLFTAAKKRQKP